jgi:hypothetical protein
MKNYGIHDIRSYNSISTLFIVFKVASQINIQLSQMDSQSHSVEIDLFYDVPFWKNEKLRVLMEMAKIHQLDESDVKNWFDDKVAKNEYYLSNADILTLYFNEEIKPKKRFEDFKRSYDERTFGSFVLNQIKIDLEKSDDEDEEDQEPLTKKVRKDEPASLKPTRSQATRQKKTPEVKPLKMPAKFRFPYCGQINENKCRRLVRENARRENGDNKLHSQCHNDIAPDDSSQFCNKCSAKKGTYPLIDDHLKSIPRVDYITWLEQNVQQSVTLRDIRRWADQCCIHFDHERYHLEDGVQYGGAKKTPATKKPKKTYGAKAHEDNGPEEDESLGDESQHGGQDEDDEESQRGGQEDQDEDDEESQGGGQEEEDHEEDEEDDEED